MPLTGAYGPVDVTVHNPPNKLYIHGAEFVDGSKRLNYDIPLNLAELQSRKLGVWNLGDLELGGETLFLGKNVSVSSEGGFFLIQDKATGVSHHILTSAQSDLGSSLPVYPKTTGKFIFPLFQFGPPSEFLGTVFDLIKTVEISSISYRLGFKSGSIGASAPVDMIIRRDDENGVVIFQERFPASAFPGPDIDFFIDLDPPVDFVAGLPFHTRLQSEEPFSLIFDSATGDALQSVEFKNYEFHEVMTLPDGTDRFTFDNEGFMVIDNEARPVIEGSFS